jgi:hypothetical protein
MAKKTADIVPLNLRAGNKNWKVTVNDLLSEKNVKGVVVTVFYKNRDYLIRHIGVRSSDLALLSAKLVRLATETDE